MNEATIPVYMVACLNVKNQDEYVQRYGMSVVAIFEKIGAEVVAVSPTPKVMEGEWGGNWTVIIRFPSMAIAEAWYESAEYQPLKELRINELTEGGSLVFVDGFDPASLPT